MQSVLVRRAVPDDGQFVAEIYNQGLDERTATFNTEHVSGEECRTRIERGGDKHPVFVAVSETSQTVGWGSISEYSPRSCYAGIGEISIYVRKDFRRQGIGSSLMQAMVDEAGRQGYWKLMGRIFVPNKTSRALCAKLGFREVGVHEKHGKLDGRWIDVVEVERLIPENIN